MPREDSLVKIDSIIYEKIRDKVESDNVNYPSIKNFIEKAVVQLLEIGKYNVEGIPHDARIYTMPLNQLMPQEGGGYTVCSTCGSAFFKPGDAKGKEARNCPTCRIVIKHLKKILDKEGKELKVVDKE